MKSRLRIRLFTLILVFTVSGIVLTTRATPNIPLYPTQTEDHLRYIDQVEKASFVIEKVSLSELVKTPSLDGFQYDHLSDEQVTLLSKQADQFIEFSKDKMKKAKKSAYITHCLTESNSDPYCKYVIRSGSMIKIKDKPKSSGVRRQDTANAFKSGNLDYLNDLTRRDLFRGLRRIKKWAEVKAIADQSLKESRCRNTHFYTTLAVKSEEYFPNRENIDYTKKLFEKNISCYLDTQVATTDYFKRILFRHALLSISDGQCAKVQPHLEVLGNEKGGDFVTRALYWNAHCSKIRGDDTRYSILKTRLLKANPLGYHNISIRKGEVFEIMKLLEDNPVPELRFRTSLSRDLNWVVRSIEMLIRKNAFDLSKRILHRHRSEFFRSENDFQLYIAYLSSRSQNTILSFQILSRLYRSDPTLITKQTLEVFYPVKHFNTLWKHRYKIDPYLAAALIRQESGFQEDARSPVGALGLMQLMPATARSMARVSRWQILKPKTNIKLGARYLNGLLERYNDDAELALAAYNAGPHRVDVWLKRYSMENRMLFLDMIPFSETRNYVSLIARNYFWYTTLYAPNKVSLLVKKGRTIASGDGGHVKFPSLKAIQVQTIPNAQ